MPIPLNVLREKKWPVPCHPIGREVIGKRNLSEFTSLSHFTPDMEFIARKGYQYGHYPMPFDYLESHIVREGTLKILPLPIPPEECGITSLVVDKTGRVFGSTAGRRCHLFLWDPKEKKHIVKIGTIDTACTKSSLAIVSDGSILLGIKPTSGESPLYRYVPGYSSNHLEKLAVPVRGEGIAVLAADSDASCVYGLSSITGTFFYFDNKTNYVKVFEPLDEHNLFSEVLVVTPDGDVYGGCRWTEIFRYDHINEQIQRTIIVAPSLAGRKMYNRISMLIFNQKDGYIYGGTSSDGLLFRFSPNLKEVISLGKPLAVPSIRCCVVTPNGDLYGIGGKEMCHLFRYLPDKCDMRDMGILSVASPRHWDGYEFDAAVTGLEGEIYFGENDRISHLFIYYPA